MLSHCIEMTHSLRDAYSLKTTKRSIVQLLEAPPPGKKGSWWCSSNIMLCRLHTYIPTPPGPTLHHPPDLPTYTIHPFTTTTNSPSKTPKTQFHKTNSTKYLSIVNLTPRPQLIMNTWHMVVLIQNGTIHISSIFIFQRGCSGTAEGHIDYFKDLL